MTDSGERLENCKLEFGKQSLPFEELGKVLDDSSPSAVRIVEKIREEVQEKLETVFGAFEEVVASFVEDVPESWGEPVKIQWPTSCSIIGNQRQKFEVDPSTKSSLNFDDGNGSIPYLPEEKLLCERVSPSSRNAFEQFDLNIPTYNVENRLTSKIRDAFEKAKETIFPCEATPSDCNSFESRLRPWFLDAQKGLNKKLFVENSCVEEQFNVSGFDGRRIVEVLQDLHKCQVELTDDCPTASSCLSCDGEDLTMNDWSFKQKIEQLHSLSATLWDLKFRLLDTDDTKSVLGLQYNDAFRFGEINTVSRLTENGVIGLDIDSLTRGPKLKNPLFKGIFDSKFKSEIFFLDSAGSFVYHPQIMVGSGDEKRYNEEIQVNDCGRIDLTYEDIHIFYDEPDASALKEDIKIMINDESKESSESGDAYEIFRISTTHSNSLLMVVKYFDSEKKALDKITEWDNNLEETIDFDIDAPDCSLIIDQKVCFGDKNSPSILIDAIEKLPNNECLRSMDGTGVFKSSDTVADALVNLGEDEYINLNINAGKEAIDKILKDYSTYLTNAAVQDVHRFAQLPDLLKDFYSSLSKSPSCEDLYRVVAVTPAGLLYSYPQYEINADYPAMFESWYTSSWKNEGVQTESRETDGYDVISKAFYDGQELLFVLAVHVKHPNSPILGWPQRNTMKFYEPILSSRSYDCLAAEGLTGLPGIYSFLDKGEVSNAQKQFDDGCKGITSWVPELISSIVTVIIIFATIVILNWYHKKERRAKIELEENPLKTNQQSSICVIL